MSVADNQGRLRLPEPAPTVRQLQARAASGASGVSKKSQAALRQIVHQQLREGR